MQKRVFSGIRATGRLHLGNYLSMAKGMLALQDSDKYEMIYSVVDLHSMTTPFNMDTLSLITYEVVLDYLACGFNPDKSMIIRQSQVADLHTQLMFYFSTVVSVARMQHLPTYKEKVKQHPQNVTMALLNYPVLMAADILIYKAEAVPVGIDQEPHLEVAREIARRMNQDYGTDFPEPKRFATNGEYVPSLTGEGKMSKTVEGSYINLTDSLEEIKSKVAKIPTDSGQGSEISGGVKTLMEFVELFEGKEKRSSFEEQYRTSGVRYSEIKEQLSAAIFKELEPIQKRRAELEKDTEYVDRVIREGAEKARKVARETVKEVREKMGLV